MATPLITAVDRHYLPGLKALWNSYNTNAGKGFDFYCIVDGNDDLFAEIEGMGIKTIRAPKWTDAYPVSAEWPKKIKSLFADLQIPQLFSDHEKAIWIDADVVILDDITGLLNIEFTQPVAGMVPNVPNYRLGFVLRNCPKELDKVPVPFGGLLIFNIQDWNQKRITEKCAEAMQRTDVVYRYGDQSVLGYVLCGDFHQISNKWQWFANRKEDMPKNTPMLHWVGGVPWTQKRKYQHLFEKYAT